jgi:hypothetical protein
MKLARGELVAQIDDDDEYEPEFLARTSEALREHPDCGFATTNHVVIDLDGQVLEDASLEHTARFGRDRMSTGPYDDVLGRELASVSFPIQTTLFRRSVLDETTLFRLGRGVDDYGLFLELGARRVKGWYIDESLGRYRVHGGQTTRDRVALSRLRLESLRPLSAFELSPDERRRVARIHAHSVVELAIAHAHRGERSSAISALRSYPELGWARPRGRRLAVLAVLFAGARRRG